MSVNSIAFWLDLFDMFFSSFMSYRSALWAKVNRMKKTKLEIEFLRNINFKSGL